MKRVGNIYGKICSLENLYLADKKARKGKGDQYGVQVHAKNWQANLLSLHHRMLTRTYRTSAYSTFKIYEPKEREVFRLPYYPDRIAHHAVMNHLEDIFTRCFTADTYSCIKGKGIHGAVKAVRNALRDELGTRYCLKMDIRKFYPSVSHRILKGLLRRKFKDEGLLWLLDEIIDSAPGLPIGNYLSQYFANFYLSGFDHWLKEVKKVRYYFRYADDLVFFAPDKESLHQLRVDIEEYMSTQLGLEVKKNYQVFPVAARGVDFVGYVFYHTHILMRKSIKKSFARMVARRRNNASIVSYYGWACHCNSNNLLKTLLSSEQVQQLQNRRYRKSVHRRQHQDRQSPQSGNHGTRLQNWSIEVREGERQMPNPGLSPRGDAPRSIYVRQLPDGDPGQDPRGSIPFHHDDRKTKRKV